MSEQLDPLGLNINLNAVETSRPVLSPGTWPMEVKVVEIQENKAKTGRNLMVVFALADEATSTKAAEEGRTNDLSPGYVLAKYYPLQQSEHPKAPDFRVDIARLIDAAFGTSQGNRPSFSEALSQIEGKVVAVRTKVRSSEEYGDQPEIVGIAPLR